MRQLLVLVGLMGISAMSTLVAQYGLVTVNDYPWTFRDGVDLTLANSGGLNNPMLSLADLDGDGLPELYVFDREGDVHLAFRQSAEGLADWTPAHELVADWPKVERLALLRDANGDGVMDLFSFRNVTAQNGISVYEGRWEGGQIAFTPVAFPAFGEDILHYDRPNQDPSFIYLAPTDVPLIEDLDGDGDLDILSFDSGGGYIDHFLNTGSVGGSMTAALRFDQVSNCYGGVFETNFSGTVELASSSGTCATPVKSGGLHNRNGVHPGSTIAAHDIDEDGDLDLLMGDISAAFVTALTNGAGPSGTAFFTEVSYTWPENSTQAQVDNFPAVFPLPLGLDGEVEYLVAPQAPGNSDDIDVLWRYGIDSETGRLSLFTRGYLSELMLDLGTGTSFALGDLSGDGVDDLLVGIEVKQAGTIQTSAFAYFEYENGRYTRRTPVWLNDLNTTIGSSLLGLVPALADMDADGDVDLILGSELGFVSYAENVATSGSGARFAQLISRWQNIELGTQTAPTVGDINGDGLLDLLVGDRTGKLNYFPNVGSASAPAFAQTPLTERFGGVDVRVPGTFIPANLKPTLATVGGQLVLYTGSQSGIVKVYGDLPADGVTSASLLLEQELNTGTDLQLGFGRDPQGRSVTFVGNARGGLRIFRTQASVSTDEAGIANNKATRWTLYPNPSTGQTFVRDLPVGSLLRIADVAGRTVTVHRLVDERLPALPNGTYLVTAQAVTGVRLGGAKKLVVLK